jgi:hypothetical protein
MWILQLNAPIFGVFPCKKTGYFDVQQDQIDEMRGKHGRELERLKARCVFFWSLFKTRTERVSRRPKRDQKSQDWAKTDSLGWQY